LGQCIKYARFGVKPRPLPKRNGRPYFSYGI
jgi:hypothetical protein